MRQYHDQLLATVLEERDRILSRRGLLSGGLKLGAGAGVAAALVATPVLGRRASAQDDATAEADDDEMAENGGFEDDIAVLNYALTLEHLEYAFYRDNLSFATGADPFGNDIATYVTAIRDHEGAHVDTLTTVITDLGGEPVAEATYDFGVTDTATFLATAAALENTGVSAYDGAGQYIENPDLLVAAGTIVSVEARHAAYLNLITGAVPFPEAFEQALSQDQVLEIAGPFIVA